MKIAVVGAGAIGSVVGALLWDDKCDVTLVGRRAQVDAVRTGGLVLDGIPGGKRFDVPARTELDFRPAIVFLAVKSHDVLDACKMVAPMAEGSIIVTMQNGVRSDELAAMVLGKERMVSSVVMFGATYLEHGRVEYNFPGGVMIGGAYPGVSADDVRLVHDVLAGSFNVHVSTDIHGAHWTKLILNLNNAMAGILGMTIQEVFKDPRMCRIGIRVMQEAYNAITGSGTELADLPDLTVGKLKGLLGAPLEVSSDIYGNIMLNLSEDPLPGSVLQSIRRGRPSEVDYLNGEIAEMGSSHGFPTPLNERLMIMVKDVENTGNHLTKQELLDGLDAG
jgi:2-dehydropantoate 2-reductase